ncbi:MAG: hypothetical protein JWL81_2229 [Verrucomicrobiales bacterium]|nr:hypothetical protein [Verrucomicrobiales bacterium]
MSEPDSDLSPNDPLKAIRLLRERSDAYRALSAPVALAAGVLTLLAGGLLLRMDRSEQLSPEAFVSLWMALLVVLAGFSIWLLNRTAKLRVGAPDREGMKLALRSLAPPLAAGLVLSTLTALTRSSSYVDIAALWALFYGLGLLAAGPFAPRELVVLGWIFFAAGLLAFFPWVRALDGRSWHSSLIYMSLTFGGLHVAYAVRIYLKQRAAAVSNDKIS